MSRDHPSTVVIADDHMVVRQGVRQLVSELPGIEILAEASNGLEAIAAVKTHQPDLLILDAAMPYARGIEVFEDARRWSPETRIVLLTGFTSIGILSDWLDAGVDGVIIKSAEPEEMKTCFSTILAGSNYICEEVRERLRAIDGKTSLTGREREVLTLIAAGNTNAAIADRLSISPKTVEKHRASLMSKLGVHSIAELMVYALREGLLDEHRQL